MEQLRNINELLFNIKTKLSDNEYIEFNKNLLILYKKQKEIDTKPLREAQHSLRQYYREEEEEGEEGQDTPYNRYRSDSDSDSDSDVEPASYYEYYREEQEQEDDNHNWISDTDTDDSDGDVESYYN